MDTVLVLRNEDVRGLVGMDEATPLTRLDELLPWNRVPEQKLDQAA